jgi:hypothetical protein
MLGGLGVRYQNVQFSLVAGSDAGGCRNVHSGVADGRRDPRQGAGRVFDIDGQVERFVSRVKAL